MNYKERLAELRKTKIRHTLEKRGQQGYMNADDYGTVPLPEGYKFTPVPNSPNGGFYGYTGMAENYCRMLDGHPIYVDPLEMLCGRWRDMMVNYRRATRWDEARFPFDELKPAHELYNITHGIDNDSHFACDYRIGFELGFGGLLDKVRRYAEINTDKKEFYDAEEAVLLAIMRFIGRHIDEIERLLESEERPEIRASLEAMLECNRNVIAKPPKTFLEACQWTAWFNCVSRIYTRDGAGFQLDGLLYPYYKADIESGRLDRDTARFIMSNLLLIDPHYYQLSGVDENDKDLTNELSYLILDAAHDLNIAANLTVRVHENCDPEFLRKAVTCLFRDRNGWPRFCGDDSLANGYMKNGFDKATARQRIAVGCNWMAIPGREFPMNDTVKINVAKVFEVAMSEMKGMGARSTELLFQLFRVHLEKAIAATAQGIHLHIKHQADVTPELVMNLMMNNCIEKGEDISRCAEIYTIGIDGAGLAVAADSFAALEQRVEREGIIDWDTVYSALESDYAGTEGERTRAILSSAERYCGGNTAGDRWAVRITEYFTEAISTHPLTWDGSMRLIPGWFSWSRTIEYGKVVGATPNGRHSGAPISHGANPNPGFRPDGAATDMSTGIAAVQPGRGNTAPLQLEFDPKISEEEGGIDRVLDLITTHFRLGGTLININVLDGEKLKAAHANPDLYPDLVVRVTGFTAYFATLSPEFRQLVVDRFVKGF